MVRRAFLWILLAAYMSVPVMASEITMTVDGVPLVSDVAPLNIDNRILVPIGPLLDLFGTDYGWDGSTRTVSVVTPETSIFIVIDSPTASVNGKAIALDVPARIIDSRTYIPARFVSEAFGADVSWDSALRQVTVTGGPLARRAAGTELMALPEETPLPEAGPIAELRRAIATLSPTFSQTITDTGIDLENTFDINEFPGVRRWSYEGVKTAEHIKLEWTFEWIDEYAVLTAYNDPALESRLTPRQNTILQKCKSIISSIIIPGMSDYQKQLAIHDYLVLNCEYDSATAELSNPSGREDAFHAYGALIDRVAVCAGYTEAAKLLLAMVGIESYRLNSSEHSWNLVKLDDGYYHMDVTWDDPVPDEPGRVRHDYFNLTDAQIIRYEAHDWLEKEKYPKANATKYNYFVYNGLVAHNYTELKQRLTDAFNSGVREVTVMIMDLETGGYNWETDLEFLFALGSGGFSYSPPDADRDTLTVTFK